MRQVLFGAAAVLAICGAVAAAEKLSVRARRKIAAVKFELQGRVKKQPLGFHELCHVESARLEASAQEEEDKTEYDPLLDLYKLKYALRAGVRKLNPYWEPEEKPERKFLYLHKEYDITDLVTVAPDRPAPIIGFGRGPFLEDSTTRGGGGGGGIIDLGDDDEGGDTEISWEKICEVLETVLGEDPGDGREIRYSGGKLICRITAEDTRKTENLLGQLRKVIGYSVNIEVKFIRTTAGYLRKLRGDGGQAIYLTPESEKQLMRDAVAKRGVELVASSELIASDGQTVHIREGRQVSMLVDYDIEITMLPALNPVVKLINEGLICQFTPTVIRRGKEVSIDVLASLSALPKEVRKGDFMGGEILFPDMAMSLLHTTVRVPDGTAVLVGGTATNSGSEDKNTTEFIFYLKPTIERKKK